MQISIFTAFLSDLCLFCPLVGENRLAYIAAMLVMASDR
jgi:hypothetical protein